VAEGELGRRGITTGRIGYNSHVRKLFIVLALVGCDSESMQAQCPPIGATAVEMCGAAPTAPGISASFDGGRASMSTADYSAMMSWRESIAAWRDCVVGID
jgi:hypothetical protein